MMRNVQDSSHPSSRYRATYEVEHSLLPAIRVRRLRVLPLTLR